jgi:hypothetical protein
MNSIERGKKQHISSKHHSFKTHKSFQSIGSAREPVQPDRAPLTSIHCHLTELGTFIIKGVMFRTRNKSCPGVIEHGNVRESLSYFRPLPSNKYAML